MEFPPISARNTLKMAKQPLRSYLRKEVRDLKTIIFHSGISIPSLNKPFEYAKSPKEKRSKNAKSPIR